VRVRKASVLLFLALVACQPAPASLPQIVRSKVDRYLSAWQKSDWKRVYAIEGRTPGDEPLLHMALTDSLAFFTVNEIRYTDSAAACAVTLRWLSGKRSVSEAGELYLTRRGLDWYVTDFKSY
jgi:hypothetical protein